MSASKTSLLAVLAFAVIAIPAAYAEDYVILTPNSTSSYYNQNFSYVATYINATLYPNATIVNFSAISDANLNATIAAKSPKFVYLVIQPANLSPDFLNSVDNLLKQLDSDSYLDVGWSVITGYDNTSAKNLFDNNMDSTWASNYVFVPNNAGAQVAAGSQIASAFSASSYVGPSATNSTINSKLTTSGTDFVYFSGNSSGYNLLISGDNQYCPRADTSGAGGCSAGMSVKNLLFFADATEAGRISGTNPDTTWLLQNSAASYLDSLPVAFSRITANAPSNASAYIGPHSTRWVTSENIVKLFASSLGQGKDIISALRFAKNALLFNNRSENLPTNFTLFVESEYTLFGKMQKPSSAPAKTYSWSFSVAPTHTQNPVIYSANTTNITWNATVAVSTSGTVAALYDSSGWKQSGATAWYRFVSPVSGNKINMSVVAALAGEIRPDNSTLNIISYSGDNLSRNITSFNISVNQTDTDFLANETLQNISSRRYDIDLDRVYFARLFSPNESLADSLQINLTYITSGIQTNRTAISNLTKNANLMESFNLINPADRGITNATLLYNLPYNVTSSCSVSQANCTIVDYGGVRYANVTLASVPQGISPLAIYYNTTLGVNTTTDYTIYNLGEILNVTSNATSQNASLLDYNAVLVNSTSGNIVWSNSTKNISVSGTINSTAYTYNISQNITSGTYTLKTYYLSNGTGLYASYEERQITITNSLNLTNATFASNVQDKLNQNYFRVNDSMTATGNVYNIRNAVIPFPYASVNVSLIGASGSENSTSTSTAAGGWYNAPFNWTGSSVGPKTLQVTASYNNNTGAQNVTLFITTYIGNNISVTFSVDKQAKRIYNLWETPVVTVNVKDPTGTLSVYKAQVNLSSGGTLLNSSETDQYGNAAITFAPSQQNSYSLSASAMSPLNTSKVAVNNTETMYVMWIKTGSNGHFVTSQNPASAIVSSPVTFYGNLTMSSGNESLITRPSDALDYQIMIGGINVRNISGCSLSWESTNSTKFSLSCTPPLAGSYQLVMQAKLAYDGVDIKTNDTYVFSAGTNATSSGTSGSSGGGTSSSLAGKSCTNNSNCTSGDYCSNNVCTAITCTDGAIIDHACVPNKKVNITAQSPLVEIEQGNWGLANFTISNNGFVGLSGVTFTLYLPQGISWADWYSFVSPAPSTLSAGVERAVSVNISAPENASIDQYLIKAKVTTKEGATDEKTFTLQVSPSARNRDIVKASIAELNSTIDALGKDVSQVMKSAPDDERQIAERKLDTIRALYIEAQAAVSKGNYFEAYTKQKEMSDVISDLRVILADKKARDSQAASRRNMIAGIVIIFAAIAGGFYYLWVPAPSGYQPGHGYSYNSGGKEKIDPEGIIDEIKKKISDLLSKLKRQEATVSRKYDYLKPPAKRW